MEEDHRAILWDNGSVRLINQRLLPGELKWEDLHAVEEVAQAIEDLTVRGAMSIGAAGALGVALAAVRAEGSGDPDPANLIMRDIKRLSITRPTARNLFWALNRMRDVLDEIRQSSAAEIREALVREALAIVEETEESNRLLVEFGQELIPEKCAVLTHCNTGFLAGVRYGTALGIISHAYSLGKKITVLVDETRPLLQGARLTTWELAQQGIPHFLITDNMAGHFMSRGEVDLVITGADRIAANGDTANKIGTYALAVLAGNAGIPFYIAAPMSTVDPTLATGDEIVIEERDEAEVKSLGGREVCPIDTSAKNPAFDVTPASLIKAIVTDRGVIRPPFEGRLLLC